MESVGEFFRQVRETKGLTVDEVASKTRIRTDFVKALEERISPSCPIRCLPEALFDPTRDRWGWMKKMPFTDLSSLPVRFMTSRVSGNVCGNARLKKERRRKANRKAVGIAITVAIATLVFLLSREQSSTLMRRPRIRCAAAKQRKSAPLPGCARSLLPPGHGVASSDRASLEAAGTGAGTPVGKTCAG